VSAVLSSPVAAAIAANLAVIRQGGVLLAALGDSRYAARQPLCFNASIGGHFRHILEHYQGFLSGLDDGEIDYEHRARDPRVENDSRHAAALLDAIAQRLEELAPSLANHELLLCAETARGIATTTTVLRELEFLLSHTIHHYALVAVMARLQGVEPAPGFGVAPSTLRFQETQAAASCAQ
jgi:uncharacterized damage-inducible protein DinB